ncbi:response regulator [Winogradskyella immobilis]|uniref:Response regulator transcription factor n=1 Tax=Winogradskyella immobilis TaxID=2816852 RepID=A0ABS8EM62_9FLAO|nr:response regulator transcription factor [Winogradskyella immobilis]MCC1484315.1 response regulator transcription factor [Winogradskyella immobilis]MCG0016407.1 response regulator transcription factor [Winogradskyella immobilis]
MTVKIIIVDDHQLFIDGIKSILAKEIDIEVIAEANNGLEVLQLLANEMQPNIIITDIRMPIMDGISLTRNLVKDYPNIKILALSMYDQTSDVIEMLDVGAKGYVTKNVEKKELVSAIHTLIKGDYFFSKNLSQDIKEWFNKEQINNSTTLTKREKEILNLLVNGRTSLQMAKQLKLSKYTIDTHRKNIHKKLGIKTNAGLVKFALQNL